MADGLFCHRYDLHIEPYRRAAVERGFVASGLNAEWHALKERLPVTVIDLLLRGGNLQEARALSEHLVRLPGPGGEKCLTVVLGNNPGDIATLSAATAREGREVLTKMFGSEGLQQLYQSSLWYLIEFGVDLVVLEKPRGNGKGAQTDVLGSVHVPLEIERDLFVSGLFREAAAQWLRLYALTDNTPIRQHSAGRLVSGHPVAERRAGAVDEVAPVVGASAAHRFLAEEVARDKPMSSSAKVQLAALVKELRTIEEAFYQITPLLPCMNAYDFAMSYFPGARQFDSYRGGAGAGQAQ